MLLTVEHITRYQYHPEATGLALRMKLHPGDSTAQNLRDWTVTVNGSEIAPLLTDGAGDRVALWHAGQALTEVEIAARGTVETTDTTGVLGQHREMMAPAVYLRETPVTRPSAVIEAIADGVAEGEVLARLHALSASVCEAVAYKSGATEATTTAAEAAAKGEGVCQDQAHIFLSAARAMGIPARYVTGYLLDPDLSGEETEQTHAWTEAHVPGLGWVGFDITHQLCPTDAYIRLASGLDAVDAAPIRGTFSGETDQDLTSTVRVAHAASQSQQ